MKQPQQTTLTALLALALLSGSAEGAEPFFDYQELFKGRGARNIVVATDGTVLAFHGPEVRRSIDGGATWSRPQRIGSDAGGNAIVDETTGDAMLVRVSQGHLYRVRRQP